MASSITTFVVLLFASSCLTRMVEENDLETNSVGDTSEESLNSAVSKYDPAFFDVLANNYFDEEEPKEPVYFEADDAPANEQSDSQIITSEKGPCLGCPYDVSTEDEKIKEIASFAFDSFSSEKGSPHGLSHTYIKVTKAQTQVVSGQKYILELELQAANCTKDEYEKNPENCLVDEEKEVVKCRFEVVERTWLNSKEVVLSTCSEKDGDGSDTVTATKNVAEPIEELNMDTDSSEAIIEPEELDTGSVELARKKREAKFGEKRDVKEDMETLEKFGNFAVKQLDVIDADNDARLLLDVLNAKKQTVSGWLYHMKIRVAQTKCPEGEEVTLERCKDSIVLPYNICNVKILFQPWQTQTMKVTESQCSPEKYRKSKKLYFKRFGDNSTKEKRNNHLHKKQHRGEKLIGGFMKVDPNSEDIAALTDFIVDSFDAQSNAMHAQKVIRVVDAQRQIVNGIKTKIMVEIGYTTCRKEPTLDKSKCDVDQERESNFCKVTVYEQPWNNVKQITKSKCSQMNAKKNDSRKKRSLAFFSFFNPEDKDHKNFGEFLDKYDKEYPSIEEYQYRLEVFKDNMKKVKVLQETEQGTATYGATQFADLTEEEFTKHYLGLRRDLKVHPQKKVKQAKIPMLRSLPDEFDWREYNAVTPVKNQGMCGSCWAFSVTGNIEGQFAIKHRNLLSFSEQELVDCDTMDQGCGGGLPENAYKALEKIGGLETEKAYPYDGKNEQCHFNKSSVKAKVTGYVEVSKDKNETEMAMWLAKKGPISIGINANAMQFYFGGVSHPWKFLCSPKTLDHGVLIVGYGVHTTRFTHKKVPYWIVKNSWGTSWGEQGYYRVYRGANTCGVAEMATSAFVA